MADNEAPPQYSPDGRWWWDGATWVPVAPAPAPPPTQRRGRLLLGLGIVAAALVGLTLTATVVSWLAGRQSGDEAASYRTLTARHTVAIKAREEAVSVCLGQTDSMPACRDQLRALDHELASFQNDLDHQIVPACLRAANVELRTAVKDMRLGVQTLMQAGPGQSDMATVMDGLGSVSSGSAHLGKAAALQRAATC